MGHAKGVRKLNCLALNSEKMKTININSFQFVDSMSYLQNSLENLTSCLKKDNYKFPLFDKIAGLYSPENRKVLKPLLLRKQYFPYEFCDSFAKLENTKVLPTREEFGNRLSNTEITEEEYEIACHFFKSFRCTNLLSYCETYCLTDCVLLAENLIEFRQMCLSTFQLDIMRFISLPSFSMSAMLKYTSAEVQPITDLNMFLWVEMALRGGYSFISQRHFVYSDVPDEKGYITSALLVDANNLYGKQQTRYLPCSNYRELTRQQIDQIDFYNYDEKSNTCYFIECDLYFDEKYHALWNFLCPCPEKRSVTFDMLSAHAKELHKTLHGDRRYVGQNKLMATLLPRINYCTTSAALTTYLRMGVEMRKIHKVYALTQSPWMEPYITLCTEKRKSATSQFGKNLFKLFINS